MLNVLEANIRKVVTELLRYLPNTFSTIVTFYAIFLMLFLGVRVMGDPNTQALNIQYTTVGTVLWMLALLSMQGIGWEITTEATRGTLEQLYMSPVGAWRILLARMVATLMANLVIIAVVLLLAMLTSGQWLSFDALTLIPLLFFLILCMIGVGFMVAGLAILFKQIQSFLQIAQFVFFALVAVPVSVSMWLELLPVVRGASMVREAMVAGVQLSEFALSDWGLLMLNALAYFGVGILVYLRAEKTAMQRGLLGQY